MTADKWTKHKGVIKFNVEDDEFIMKPTIDHVAEYFSKLKEIGFKNLETTDGRVKLFEVASKLGFEALKNANPEVPEDILKTFCDNNKIIVANVFMDGINMGNDRISREVINKVTR